MRFGPGTGKPGVMNMMKVYMYVPLTHPRGSPNQITSHHRNNGHQQSEFDTQCWRSWYTYTTSTCVFCFSESGLKKQGSWLTLKSSNRPSAHIYQVFLVYFCSHFPENIISKTFFFIVDCATRNPQNTNTNITLQSEALTTRVCKLCKIIKYYIHDGSMHLAISGNCVQLAGPPSESSILICCRHCCRPKSVSLV